ncbi:MAG: hypothetical protein WC346_01680 [Methanogenium sp.]
MQNEQPPVTARAQPRAVSISQMSHGKRGCWVMIPLPTMSQRDNSGYDRTPSGRPPASRLDSAAGISPSRR